MSATNAEAADSASKQALGRLDEKVLVITGAAQGIGLATAELAIEFGATVVIADVQLKLGRESASSVGASFVELDIKHEESVKRAVDVVIAEHGRIDVLVNNAGALLIADLLSTSPDELRNILEIDLVGLFALSNEVARHMIKAGKGSIVNLASVSASIALHPETLPAYSAAKGAVAQLTRNQAAEWMPLGVRVNAVSPGRVSSPMLVNATTEETREIMAAQTPLGRLIDPREIAAAVLFLASDGAAAVNGHNLVVDGGMTIV